MNSRGFAPVLSQDALAYLHTSFKAGADFNRTALFGVLSLTADELWATHQRKAKGFDLARFTLFNRQLRLVDEAAMLIYAASERMAICDASPDAATPVPRDSGALRGIGRLHPHNFGPVASAMTLRRYDRRSGLFFSKEMKEALHVLSLNTDQLTRLSIDDASWFRNLRYVLNCCYPGTISVERAPLACVIERMRFCDRTLVHLRIAGLVADGETTAANAPVYSKAKTPDWRTQRPNRSNGTIADAAKLPKPGQTERTKAKCTAECGLQSFA